MKIRPMFFGVTCVVITILILLARAIPGKPSLESIIRKTSLQFPTDFVVKQGKSFEWEKDPRWFWSLNHATNNLEEFLRQGFRLWNSDEATALKSDILITLGENELLAGSTELYAKSKGAGKVYFLLDRNRTNSWVAYFSH